MRPLLQTSAGRAVSALVGLLVVATIVALAVLWPSGSGEEDLSGGLAEDTVSAEVVAVTTTECAPGGGTGCGQIEVRLSEGADAGEEAQIQLLGGGLDPDVEVGDEVRVARGEAAPGSAPAYTLADFERRTPMLWLAIAFCALVVIFGRLRGVLSLVGLVASLTIVLVFVVPAIRDGEEPLAVALAGSFAMMLLTIALAHGVNAKSMAAVAGTGASLLIVVALASIFTELTHLTGFSSEEATILVASGSDISVQGLLLAGMVIGALGVLDDVTISQSSTVMALRAANAELGARELYRHAIEVGRDHVSATVNTLVLAYVGAALPVLLIFSSGTIGFVDAANVELVAKEIVAMLVGSIGLIAAVPLTTALAAVLAVRLPERVAAEGSAHGHAH